MSAAARCISSGLILIVLGLLLGIGWFFSHHSVTNTITTDQVRDAIVIESTHSKGYYNWEEGYALNNPNYFVFYLWNITNPADVLNGSVAQYEQLGPYYYKYIWYNKNATFLDGGNIVQYNLVEDYIFLPEMSQSDPTKDMITTFNPAYVTILSTADGDSNVLVIAALPVISSFLDFLTGEYVDLMSSQYTPEVLSATVQSIYSFLAAYFQYDLPTAQEYFFSCWANGTTLPPYFLNWPGMFPTIVNGSSIIPAPTVAELFSNHSFSLLDASSSSIIIIYWLRAANDMWGPEANALAKTFSLTPPQLQAVLLWRNASFVPIYVHPVLIAQAEENYPLATLSDIGWVQYTTTNFTSPSFSAVYSQWYPQYPSPIEVSAALAPNAFTVAQLKLLLTGPYGILNLQNFGLFQAATDLSLWGVDQTQASFFVFYMSSSDLESYTKPIVTAFVNSGDTGLIITKSADYWLWRCADPLVSFLAGPENAYCGLQTNNTVQPPSQMYTGKNDLSQVGSYVSWRNQSSVDFWSVPVTVSGCTDNGQFSPFLKENQTLYVWDETFVKTLEFDAVGKTQVQGIDVYKYVLNEKAFDVSQVYTNTIEGFANETSTNQGAPIFLSNFDFYGVTDPKYANFSGLMPNSSDVTTIYVEPYTGSTLQADEKLQVNLYYPKDASGWHTVFPQFKKVKPDLVYPLMKAWQKSCVSEAQATKLRHQLIVFTPRFNSWILWGLVAFGALLFVIGVALVITGYRRRQRDGNQLQKNSKYFKYSKG